jgi:rRNA processing protein Gar1
MYAVHDNNGKRIGTIMKVMGEPPKTRWVAYASKDRSKGFPTRTRALEWIEEIDREEKEATKGPE